MKMNFLLLVVSFLALSITLNFIIRLVIDPGASTQDLQTDNRSEDQATDVLSKDISDQSNNVSSSEAPSVKMDLSPSVRVRRRASAQLTREYVDRFPYLLECLQVAILRDADGWSFACAGALVLRRWALAAARCARGGRHQARRLKDEAQGRPVAYPVLFWKTHPDATTDLALARVDLGSARLPLAALPGAPVSGALAEAPAGDLHVENSHHEDPLYLKPVHNPDSSDRSLGALAAAGWRGAPGLPEPDAAGGFETYEALLVDPGACEPVYGALGAGVLCVDLSRSNSCLSYALGPLFSGDTVTGVLTAAPPACGVRVALFTAVADHHRWLVAAAGGR